MKQQFRQPPRNAEDRTILIEASGSTTEVRIDPPLPGGRDYDRAFPTDRAARRYANELRGRLRLTVLDSTGRLG